MVRPHKTFGQKKAQHYVCSCACAQVRGRRIHPPFTDTFVSLYARTLFDSW